MTIGEFVEATADILQSSINENEDETGATEMLWFHFEGRIPESTLECVRYLRQHAARYNSMIRERLHISVELEIPKRQGFQALTYEADLVFYSKNWAEAEGYGNAETCLREQAKLLTNHAGEEARERTLICNWSECGACALLLPAHDSKAGKPQEHPGLVYCPAYRERDRPVTDTVGAGDTFIAGVMFAHICRGGCDEADDHAGEEMARSISQERSAWSLEQKLGFANELAGRKILQHGLQGLAEQLQGLMENLDYVG